MSKDATDPPAARNVDDELRARSEIMGTHPSAATDSAATTELEAWHARYDQAIREGRSLQEAITAADTTPQVAAAAKCERERRDGIYVPVQVRPIEVRSGPWIGPPDESSFEPVFLTPHELRRVAERKRAGETL